LSAEEPVFLFAGSASATESASREESDSEERQAHRNPDSHRVEPNHERVQLKRKHYVQPIFLTDESFPELPTSRLPIIMPLFFREIKAKLW
jgi:hypothetical protein